MEFSIDKVLAPVVDKANASKAKDYSADKYFQKAGYQDSLLFNPHTNVIRYGSYEFFADQVGIKPEAPEMVNKAKNAAADYEKNEQIPASQKLYGTNGVQKTGDTLLDFVPPNKAQSKIPNTIEFVNMLNEKAKQISANAEMGQTTDNIKKPQNTRLGKANYSRASNVLTDSQGLGGASTLLGG